jgi:hypothetical protein
MNKTIYFFLIPYGVSRDNYPHQAVVLAEGLKELGWRIFANVDYWRSSPDDPSVLFCHDENVRPSDCAVNVLTYDWMHFVRVMPYEFAENNKSCRVFIEDSEGVRLAFYDEFKKFDVVLRTQSNSRAIVPSNFRPWAFALTNRILAETADVAPVGKRRNALLVNFGSTHDYRHELRELFEARVYPKLAQHLDLDRTTNRKANPPSDAYHRLMWEQTAWRHYPDYYERLCHALACSCVGGQFVSAGPRDWTLLEGGNRARLRRLWYGWRSRIGRATPRWNQWDGWRFWESLAAGCAGLMLDFDKYGVQLPVQPENWKHYVGLDLDHLPRDLERLTADPSTLATIGAAGRSWVLQNYTPIPMAKLFLKVIER